MKIVAFSDIHGQITKNLTEWFENNPADLLLFAGDIQMNNSDSGMKFISWLHRLPYTRKILTFGNHDGNYIYVVNFLRRSEFPSITVLNNESTTVDGIKIFGSPYSVEYGNWYFMKRDSELAGMWQKIPDDVNILLTHCPPYGILDSTCDG